MRRIAIVAALVVAAAALPAAASAHHGDHGKHGTNGKHLALAGTKGKHLGLALGHWCRVHGKAGDDHAGKVTPPICGRPVPPPVAAKAHLAEFAFGTVSSFGAAGCNTSTAGCALAASGSIEGTPIAHGTFTAALTAVWTSATSNGSGGYCAPTAGTVTLAVGSDSIVESVQGTLCEIGATGTNVGHVFRGGYSITSGTGAYASAKGRGVLGFYQPSGSAAIAGLEVGR